jgi:hypothetical protein
VAEELDRDDGPALGPPTEEIHLPDPSYLPPVMALGITLMIVGIVLGLPVIIVGAIVFLITLVRWVRQTREEMQQLPLDH